MSLHKKPNMALSMFPSYNFPDISVFELLNEILGTMVLDLKRPFIASLTEDMHVLPDFHGNR